MHKIIDDLRAALPPVWLGTRTDELTGGAICWGTTQNRRSRGEIPEDCFARSGTRVLVLRDPFLAWWATTLSPARRPPMLSPSRDRRRRGRKPEPPLPDNSCQDTTVPARGQASRNDR
jgi:hypothetical protein